MTTSESSGPNLFSHTPIAGVEVTFSILSNKYNDNLYKKLLDYFLKTFRHRVTELKNISIFMAFWYMFLKLLSKMMYQLIVPPAMSKRTAFTAHLPDVISSFNKQVLYSGLLGDIETKFLLPPNSRKR